MVEEDLPKGVQVEEIEIPVPWGHVAARWWGPREKQPVIAIHGWLDNAGTWDKLLPLLPSKLSVICIDLPGHGLSSHYNPGKVYYVLWDGIVVLRNIIKHFEWKNVILLGHSLGAIINFMYSAIFPDEVDRIVCIDSLSPANLDPQMYVPFTGISIDSMLKYENVSNENFVYSYGETLSMLHEGHVGSMSKESCKILMKRGTTKKGNGYYFNRDLRLVRPILGSVSLECALEFAGKVKCKVLFIKAKPGETVSKQENQRKVIEKLKENTDIKCVEVAGTHHVHLNTPEKVVPILENYFKDLFY